MTEPKPNWLSPISAYGQGRMAETKPIWLSLISGYGQGRMAYTKPVWLSLISTHWQWRMAEHKPVRLSLISAHLFSFLCSVLLYVFTFWVPSCDAHYDVCIKRCSVHFYLQVFVGGPMSYLRYLCFLRIVVSNTYFVVCLFRLSSSCCHFSGLSILDCSFGIHLF